LRDKRLRDVCKALKIKGFGLVFIIAVFSKATLKPPYPPLAQHHHKTVENQALHDAN
jgi:hypothetical protein